MGAEEGSGHEFWELLRAHPVIGATAFLDADSLIRAAGAARPCAPDAARQSSGANGIPIGSPVWAER